MQLEEFKKKKKQAALAKKQSSLPGSVVCSPEKQLSSDPATVISEEGHAGLSLPPGSAALDELFASGSNHPSSAQYQSQTHDDVDRFPSHDDVLPPVSSTGEVFEQSSIAETDSLRDQVGQLLESVDQLHRALQASKKRGHAPLVVLSVHVSVWCLSRRCCSQQPGLSQAYTWIRIPVAESALGFLLDISASARLPFPSAGRAIQQQRLGGQGAATAGKAEAIE